MNDRRFASPERRRSVRGWVLYDFAESTFSTSILVAILPIYFLTIARDPAAVNFFGDIAINKVDAAWSLISYVRSSAVVPAGSDLTFSLFGIQITTAASSLWGYIISISTLTVALISPVLGAIADCSGTKKRFLAFFAFIGAFFSGMLVFVGQGDYLMASAFFMLANIGSAAGNVFYNALLPDVADSDSMDWVSGRGFSMGYLGGGLLLIINLLMIQQHELFGIPTVEWATRLCFVSVGIWWALFTLPILLWVHEYGTPAKSRGMYVRTGFQRIGKTLKKLRKLPDLLLFFLAYLIYNDGIQTVIVMATPFGKEVLDLDEATLIGTLLMIQIIGIPGSLAFGRLAQYWGAKRTVMLSLVIWSGVVIYAWQMTSGLEFWILGGLVGVVLGGSQAISRSLYAVLIPKRQAAEFYGFLSFSSRFASFIGPLVFALTRDITGSMRSSILVLIAFFLIGSGILSIVNVRRGREAAAAMDNEFAASPTT